MRGLLCGVVLSCIYEDCYRIFGEHVIMEKGDAQKNIFLSWLLVIVMFELEMWEVFMAWVKFVREGIEIEVKPHWPHHLNNHLPQFPQQRLL